MGQQLPAQPYVDAHIFHACGAEGGGEGRRLTGGTTEIRMERAPEQEMLLPVIISS